jgi:hypothetical protein
LAESAARLLHDVRQLLVAQRKALVFSRIHGRAVVEAALRHALPEGDNGYLSFEDNDLAVEWCEDRLLEFAAELSPRVSTVAAFPLFAEMPERTLARLQERMQSADYPVARSASVHADTAVRSWTLSAEVLDELAIDYPEIKIAVLGNLSRDLAQKLRQANQLIGILAA